MNNKHIWMGLILVLSLTSCKKYLDQKPDDGMVLPATLEDCQQLLDNYTVMNTAYPNTEPLADNYYLTNNNWNIQQPQQKDIYIWKTDADLPGNIWQKAYEKILYANQVLETLGKIDPAENQTEAWKQLKGSALFYRAFSFYHLAAMWCMPYDPQTAAANPGIPLRLSADISEKYGRGTLQQTYARILEDLSEASTLLSAAVQPTSVINKCRPTQAAAQALQARVYLSMGDYPNALVNADLCLKNYRPLLNFSTLNVAAPIPFPVLNAEVIFHSTGLSMGSMLVPAIARIDSSLYLSYENNDLRKVLYFAKNAGAGPATYQFKGGYGGANSVVFCGITTAEIYMIRAESYARTGNATLAMQDLNTLLKTRWSGTYSDRTAPDAISALAQILAERRKELIFRSLRWSDLKRLNKDPRFAVSLSRVINGTTYTLPANDLRYVPLIPREVLRNETLEQNPR